MRIGALFFFPLLDDDTEVVMGLFVSHP